MQHIFLSSVNSFHHCDTEPRLKYNRFNSAFMFQYLGIIVCEDTLQLLQRTYD